LQQRLQNLKHQNQRKVLLSMSWTLSLLLIAKKVLNEAKATAHFSMNSVGHSFLSALSPVHHSSSHSNFQPFYSYYHWASFFEPSSRDNQNITSILSINQLIPRVF
jgi:hypothetical protein